MTFTLKADGTNPASFESISTNSTIGAEISEITAAVTATLPGSPSNGETHLIKRNLSSGTPTLEDGTAGNLWKDGVTAASYDFETDGAQVSVYWNGTYWMVTGISGVVT